MARQQRLELTWIGKENQPKLEPRILIEDPEKSYGDPHSENMLIDGDNLLALKALEQDFAGKIKCIYIDPPFNTGQAFDHYDDSLEHSLWLNLMRDRLKILHNLLSADGSIFVHIDDNEMGYLIVLLDDIFGRSNRESIITFKQGSPTGHKAINPGCVTTTNFILLYVKNKSEWRPNKVFTARERNRRYNRFIINRNEHYSKWEITTLSKAFADSNGVDPKKAKSLISDYETKLDEFVFENASNVIQLARPSYKGVSAAAREMIDISKKHPNRVFHLERVEYEDFYFIRGERILFYSNTLKEIDGKYVTGEPLTTLWDDIPSHNLHNEGGISFPKGKKPESLLKRIFDLTTTEGDWVLDSFLGSGTTIAVAHKIKRKWIGIELREHCHTLCIPRLKNVIDGTNQSGITKAVNWQGGGGFKYYYLAPSLLKKDRYGNWIIDERYNPDMLAAAMAKHEGFRYNPDEQIYWKQGQSTEKDFIYTTTQFVTVELLDKIHEEMHPDESLLITCKAFQEACERRHANITVKKIPNMLLGRCEFGREDYSLNIVNMPLDPDAPEFVPPGPEAKKESKPGGKNQLDLFSADHNVMDIQKDREDL